MGRGGGGGGGMNCLTMLACSSVTCKKIGKDKIVKRVVYHLHSAVFTCLLCSARTNKKNATYQHRVKQRDDPAQLSVEVCNYKKCKLISFYIFNFHDVCELLV